MDTDEKKILVKKYFDAYNFFDVESMKLVLHNKIKFVSIVNNEIEIETNGLKEFTDYVEKNNKMHYSRKQTIKKIIVENDKIIIELNYTILDANNINEREIFEDDIELFGNINFGFIENKIINIVDERHNTN